MKRPLGYSYTFSPDHDEEREHSITCSHCDMVVFVPINKPASSVGCGFCPKCELYTCPKCTARKRCTPLDVRLQRMERPKKKQGQRRVA